MREFNVKKQHIVRIELTNTISCANIPSLTVYKRKNGASFDFTRAVAIFPFVTICAIFSSLPVLTVLFL